MNIIAIIQARMNSRRLPNKMLLDFHGHPICEWVFRRVLQANKINKVVFAIPEIEQDDLLETFLESIGAEVFRGSEFDVVDRFYKVAKELNADHIVRICADNPLISPDEIDRLIDFYYRENCDYAYNHMPKKNLYPDGLGAEICSMEILDEIHKKSYINSHREHLFNYLWDNENNYNIKTFNPPVNISYPQIKLDIDTPDDYEALLSKKYMINMSAVEIINLAKHKNENN